MRTPDRIRILLLVAIVVSTLSCDSLTGVADKVATYNWTGRYVTDARNLGWASLRDLTSGELDTAVGTYTSRGYLPINTGARPQGSAARYSIVWRENFEDRGWNYERDLTSTEYNEVWTEMRDQNYRPLDVEPYLLGGNRRFAGIWVENTEGLEWWSQRNMTRDEYDEHSVEQEAAGRRPTDVEVYSTPSGVRLAAIWYENVDGLEWAQLRDATRTEYQQEVDQQSAAGYRMIDFESYEISGTQYYAAIWEKPAKPFAAAVRTNRSSLQFANLWRGYRDEGYRVVDLEQYDLGGSSVFGGIWIENADRFRYRHKAALDNAISNYQQNQGPSGEIPGLSVAIIEDGEMIYRRGFGSADVDGGKVAHGETVYLAASVSKVIGGTLAARLEETGRLRDGTSVDLDLTDSTSVYLPNIPSSHSHTLEQLSAHLGCVSHYPCPSAPTGYCTYPGISDNTMDSTHYSSAQTAAAALWSTALIDSVWTGSRIRTGCTIGTTRRYSTPGFTLLGAAVEAAAGRSLSDLVTQELAVPFDLASMRALYASPSIPTDYDRAIPYSDGGDARTHSDNSWKIFGGGIETHVVDLAEFGWKVLDAQIVAATTRDDQLWNPVNCPTAGSPTCTNGISWALDTTDSGRRFAQHGGSWTGAGAHLRIYRDDGLVIAIMSNQTGHSPSALTGQLADIVLP